MNKPGKKWSHKKFGLECPGKFGATTKKCQTKKRIIRSDKKKSKRLLDKYFNE